MHDKEMEIILYLGHVSVRSPLEFWNEISTVKLLPLVNLETRRLESCEFEKK